MARKRRTRQHVIADIGINHVERQALLAGFALDRVEHDYGIDLFVSTYDDSGGVENGYLLVQVKATDHLDLLADRQTIALRIERTDIDWWISELLPVILVIYDAQADIAYGLDVQAYFAHRATSTLSEWTRTVTIHIAIADRLDAAAFRQFRARKECDSPRASAMRTHPVTYQDLDALLERLRFVKRSVQVDRSLGNDGSSNANGTTADLEAARRTTGYLFAHKATGAQLLLPLRPSDDPVAPHHLNAARRTLVDWDVLSDAAFDGWLCQIQSHGDDGESAGDGTDANQMRVAD